MNRTNYRHLLALAVIGLLLIGLAQPALADLLPRTTPTRSDRSVRPISARQLDGTAIFDVR